jgi:hypothetical protein
MLMSSSGCSHSGTFTVVWSVTPCGSVGKCPKEGHEITFKVSVAKYMNMSLFKTNVGSFVHCVAPL